MRRPGLVLFQSGVSMSAELINNGWIGGAMLPAAAPQVSTTPVPVTATIPAGTTIGAALLATKVFATATLYGSSNFGPANDCSAVLAASCSFSSARLTGGSYFLVTATVAATVAVGPSRAAFLRSVTVLVGAGGDDGFGYTTGGGAFDFTGTELKFGQISGNNIRTFARFQINLPKDTPIVGVDFQCEYTSNGANQWVGLARFENVDSSAAPANATALLAKAVTTGVSTSFYSGSVGAVSELMVESTLDPIEPLLAADLTAVLARSGWAANNYAGLIFDTTSGSGVAHPQQSFEAGDFAPRMEVSYADFWKWQLSATVAGSVSMSAARPGRLITIAGNNSDGTAAQDGSLFSTTDQYVFVGRNASPILNHRTWERWTVPNIGRGTTILQAYFQTGQPGDGRTGPTVSIGLEQDPHAAIPVSAADTFARTVGDTVSWGPLPSSGTDPIVTSADFAALLQTLVNLSTWDNAATPLVLIDYLTNAGGTADGRQLHARDLPSSVPLFIAVPFISNLSATVSNSVVISSARLGTFKQVTATIGAGTLGDVSFGPGLLTTIKNCTATIAPVVVFGSAALRGYLAASINSSVSFGPGGNVLRPLTATVGAVVTFGPAYYLPPGVATIAASVSFGNATAQITRGLTATINPSVSFGQAYLGLLKPIYANLTPNVVYGPATNEKENRLLAHLQTVTTFGAATLLTIKVSTATLAASTSFGSAAIHNERYPSAAIQSVVSITGSPSIKQPKTATIAASTVWTGNGVQLFRATAVINPTITVGPSVLSNVRQFTATIGSAVALSPAALKLKLSATVAAALTLTGSQGVKFFRAAALSGSVSIGSAVASTKKASAAGIISAVVIGAAGRFKLPTSGTLAASSAVGPISVVVIKRFSATVTASVAVGSAAGLVRFRPTATIAASSANGPVVAGTLRAATATVRAAASVGDASPVFNRRLAATINPAVAFSGGRPDVLRSSTATVSTAAGIGSASPVFTRRLSASINPSAAFTGFATTTRPATAAINSRLTFTHDRPEPIQGEAWVLPERSTTWVLPESSV